MDKSKIKGILAAMVTPTDSEGKVNKLTARRLVNHLIDSGVDGLVPVAGTGEFMALSPMERVAMVETVVDETAGRVPVVPGVLNTGFKEAVITGKDFKKVGADAILLITPYYIYPTQEGIREYFNEFISKVKLPVIIYDVPSRTKVSLEPATINKMIEGNKMIIGIKACNTDLGHFSRMMLLVKDKISVLSGDDILFMPQIILGAKGGILATANLFQRPWIKMLEMISNGDIDGAKRIHFSLIPLMDALFAECNPGPLKEAMAMVGIDVGHALRPLSKPSPENMKRLKSEIKILLDNS